MTYQTLYRKYRPQRFADVVSQTHVTRTLQNALHTGKIAHAYLMCGPRGTGKTTTARILAKALNCAERSEDVRVEPCNKCSSCLDIARGVSFDVSEIDAASNRGIDDIRAISEAAQQAGSNPERFRVFIIDEAHQTSRDGASAFLKTLEEPTDNVVFILATTDPEKMIPTILSRCQRFDFRPVSISALVDCLRRVSETEAIVVDDDALEAIARRAHGGVRDALGILEQAWALAGESISTQDIVSLFGGIDTTDLADIFDFVSDEDAGGVLRHIDGLLARGIEARSLTKELCEYARGVFVISVTEGREELVDIPEGAYERVTEQARKLGSGQTSRVLTTLGQVLVAMPQSLSPRIDLEVALVTLSSSETKVAGESLGALAARLDHVERVISANSDSVPPQSDVLLQDDKQLTEEDEIKVIEHPPDNPSEPAEPGLDSVLQRWEGLLEEIKEKSRRVAAFYVGAKPIALEGDLLTVQFAHKFNSDHATDDSGRALFEDVCVKVIGRHLQVKGTFEERNKDESIARKSEDSDEISLVSGLDNTEVDLGEEPASIDSENEVQEPPPSKDETPILDLVSSELGGTVVEEPSASEQS